MKQINLIRKDVLVHAAIRYPLTDLIPLRQNGGRDFQPFSEDQLVKFAGKFVVEKGIGCREELKRTNRGLYEALKKRQLLDKFGLSNSNVEYRDWALMADEELVGFARRFVEKNEIGARGELAKADNGLYYVLGKRRLLDAICLEKKVRDWASMGDDELVGFAKRFAETRKIGGLHGLEKADGGLYDALRRRRLQGSIGFEARRRDWAPMTDETMVGFARRFIDRRKIGARAELAKADSALYQALRKRKLLGEVGLKDKNRSLESMSDEVLVGFAKNLIEEKKISRREELKTADWRVYDALRKRKLMDSVGLGRCYRHWASFGVHELVSFARRIIEERGIGGRSQLEKADNKLYQALLKRKLIDSVFSPIESENQSSALTEVIDSVREFGDAG